MKKGGYFQIVSRYNKLCFSLAIILLATKLVGNMLFSVFFLSQIVIKDN